jgi:hypothetical protein
MRPTTPLRLFLLALALSFVVDGAVADRASGTATKPAPTLTGSIVQVDKMFVCAQPVDLDLLQVTITDAAAGKNKDAVLLRSGCTGTIRRLVISNTQCDGVKGGAANLTIQGGTIDLPARRSDRECHQDAVQISAGTNITFSQVTIRGGGHSGFFINGAQVPSNVLLTASVVGSYPGRSDIFDTDVTIGDSISSGVSNSTLYAVKQPKLAPAGVYIPSSPSTGGTQARDPINVNNRYISSS